MANQTMSNLRTYKAICDTNIKPCPPPKTLSQDHESKLIFAKRRYCLIMLDILVILYWMFLSLYKSQNTLPSPTFILFPSHFNDSFGKMHRPGTCPTALESHKSGTPLVHHLIPFIFTVSRPGATDPVCQAPGLGSFIANVIAPQVDLRNRPVDFQCFGKGLWTKTMANQTMSNLRTYKAICHTNIKPCPPPKTLSQGHESKLIFAKRRYCLIMLDILVILNWMFLYVSLPVQVSEHPPKSHFHIVSIPFQ